MTGTLLGEKPWIAAALGLMTALGGAATAQAQDAERPESFQLPPQRPEPAAGPVDEQNPVARPTAKPPVTTPPVSAPTASAPTVLTPNGPGPAPTVTLPADQPRAERPTRARPAPTRPAPTQQEPAQQAPSGPATVATPATALPPAAATPTSPPDAMALPTASDEPKAAPDVAAPASAKSPTWLWPALGALAAILAAAVLLLVRRKSAAPEAEDDIPFVAIEPRPRPAPTPASPPAARPAAPDAALQPSPSPHQVIARAPSALTVVLEAEQFSGSVFYATLSYRLTVTNAGTTGTGPLRLSGDMVSAHAAIDPREQLSPDIAALVPQHDLPGLASGESVVLAGTLRLPLSALMPMAGGKAFVPLARFHVASADGCEPALAETRIFVVGPAGENSGDALQPFRFAQLPGVIRGLGQREIRTIA